MQMHSLLMLLDRLCWSVHGSGRVCSDSADSRSRFALTGILEPQGSVNPVLNLLGGVMFITWWLRQVMRSKAFLRMLGVSWLRPWARTYLKWPCAKLVRLVGQKTNTDECVCIVSERRWTGVNFCRACKDRHPRASVAFPRP